MIQDAIFCNVFNASHPLIYAFLLHTEIMYT
jgi:hypothetical protein